MDKNLNYAELYKKVYKEIYKIYFPKYLDGNPELKLPDNYRRFLEKGLDKLVIKIPRTAITSNKDITRINIRGNDFFTKLYAGIKNNSYYCRLELNPAKIFYEDNIKNLNNGKDIRKIIERALKEIKNRGYKIDLDSCILNYVEVNKMVMLNPNDLNQKGITVLTDEVSMGHFKNNSNLYKKSTKPISFAMGTKVKGIVGYDKTLEVLAKTLGKNSESNLSTKSLRELAKGYKLFFRLEVIRSKASLEKLLSPTELNLNYFLENTKDILDKIFDSTIEEAGLTKERYESVNSFKTKTLAYGIKKYKNLYPRSFALEFLYAYDSQIWGIDQVKDAIDLLGGSKQFRYMRKKRFEKKYFSRNYIHKEPLESSKFLKNLIENI